MLITPEKLAESGTEDGHQSAVMQWAALNRLDYPELEMLAHCPNGGMREAREGARMKKLGVKPGYPDLMLNVARRGFHSLLIEMKNEKGIVSKDQERWHSMLTREGNCVGIAYNWKQAVEMLIWYLSGAKNGA